MATLLAAGAASCAGYIIGNLAVKKSPQPHQPPRLPPRIPRPQHVHHLPPRQAVVPAQPTLPTTTTTYLQAGVVPIPKRVMPGQCYLCESWFQHGDVVAKLYCGHVFHRPCMETFARQPVYENFRCTCIICRGGSWITRFAVTEISTPAAPSVAPFTPVVPPAPIAQPVAPVHVPQPPAAPVVPVHIPPPPAAQPVAPVHVPPPPPVQVQSQLHTRQYVHSVLTPVSSTSAATSSQSASSASQGSQQPQPVLVQNAPAVAPRKSRHHTYITLNENAATTRPSCTLCTCKLCLQNNDGNCAKCGRCLCYECMYADCECCCSCTPDVASYNDFIPLY